MFECFVLEMIDCPRRVCACAAAGPAHRSCSCTATLAPYATWHRVAPLLAESHTAVCPDLRGYRCPSKPPTTPDHAPSTMAN